MLRRMAAVGAVVGVMALAVGVVASVARAGGVDEFEAELEDSELIATGGIGAGASTSASIGAPDSSSTTVASSTTSPTVGTSSTTSTSVGSTTSTSTSIPGDDDDDQEFVAPMSLTFLAGAAGSVDVLMTDDEIVFAGASALAGWEFEVDHAGGSHVDVDFHHEDGTTLEFRVDVDLRVRIEIDRD